MIRDSEPINVVLVALYKYQNFPIRILHSVLENIEGVELHTIFFKNHYTNEGIIENGYFSVNIPSESVVQKMDYVGLVSGREVDKSEVFSIFYGADGKTPMIEECPANLLCKVYETVDLENYYVFFGEIIETYVNDDCLTDDKPDMKKIDQVFLSGGKYCHVGKECGSAFSDGRALIK